MPFGLINAPSTFQSLVNEIFRPMMRKFVLVFFCDILVYSLSWDAHIGNVKEVMLVLEQHQLVSNHKSAPLLKPKLNTWVTSLKSVMEWPTPKNVKGVRGFLGITRYYQKFIKNYGKMAKPRTELTNKEAFVWNSNTHEAFEELKQSLTTAPVLALSDFSQEFVVESDASGKRLGAILIQVAGR